ncbi:a64972bc-2320-488a-9e87-668e53af8c28 [Thermothielavioides terrestris]|nr:a64972bc-2320-488a-9e87-668e53af8c28 [Thermothielavioides terrestris]
MDPGQMELVVDGVRIDEPNGHAIPNVPVHLSTAGEQPAGLQHAAEPQRAAQWQLAAQRRHDAEELGDEEEEDDDEKWPYWKLEQQYDYSLEQLMEKKQDLAIAHEELEMVKDRLAEARRELRELKGEPEPDEQPFEESDPSTPSSPMDPRLRRAHAILRDKRMQLGWARDRLDVAWCELKPALEKLAALKQELKEAREQGSRIEALQEEAEERAADLQQQVTDLTTELERARGEVRACNEDLRDTALELIKTKEELEAANRKIKAMESGNTSK